MEIKEADQIKNIKNFAFQVRKNILEMAVSAGSSSAHFGGALSITEIVSTLFGGQMKIDKKNPQWEDRDRFILSKGHAAIALYSVLADVGFINSEELVTFCTNGTRLGGHASNKVPGVEIETGSLGHGLGVGCGIAWGAKINKCDYKIMY